MANKIKKGMVCIVKNPITMEEEHVEPENIKVNGVSLEEILNRLNAVEKSVKAHGSAIFKLMRMSAIQDQSIQILNEEVNK